ncbi:hypothetical protein AALP_AA4G106100 [Arabis alpina]|uniref:Uncharacterized protein n=1 Tax=Arabis alpina TaxID=50452 RepID=A0A087H2G0_ARAAL|nr:hypothetical protein AALP_AA4G106100 [Arabis alpina]
MYPSSKQETRFEWELTKENVRPLKKLIKESMIISFPGSSFLT